LIEASPSRSREGANCGRRRISTIEVKVSTGTPSWLVTVVADRNEPISGLLRDGFTSTIVLETWSVSPG
jgi:hypothetical protein